MDNSNLQTDLTFDPELFKELAETLLYDSDYDYIDEARCRTVISRLYYAIFLRIRETLLSVFRELNARTLDLFKRLYRTGEIHATIRDVLMFIDPFIGHLFANLGQLRRDADYNLRKRILPEETEEALRNARELQNSLQDVSHILRSCKEHLMDISLIMWDRVWIKEQRRRQKSTSR